MFAAAEVALFSMALMARQNLGALGVPGTPGVLVWVVTGGELRERLLSRFGLAQRGRDAAQITRDR